MPNPVSRYLERRRQLHRCAQFVGDIERYRREVLAPRGLGEFEPRAVAEKRRRQVFLGDRRVWKFYRTNRRDARNAVGAAERLQAAGIRGPRTEFSDVSSETKNRYRLSCIVMNRLEGQALGRSISPDDIGKLAAFLARLHSVRSEGWGECYELKREGFVEEHFLQRLRSRLDYIGEWLGATGQGDLPPILSWFEKRGQALQPSSGGYCLVSADAQPRNFLSSPDGELCLIDLDRARFLDFPVDLVQFMPLEKPLLAAGRDARGDELIQSIEVHSSRFLETYFAAAPSGFADHWRRTREAYVLYQMVLKLYGVLRRRQVKFSLFKKVDPAHLETQARHYLSVIERLVAED